VIAVGIGGKGITDGRLNAPGGGALVVSVVVGVVVLVVSVVVGVVVVVVVVVGGVVVVGAVVVVGSVVVGGGAIGATLGVVVVGAVVVVVVVVDDVVVAGLPPPPLISWTTPQTISAIRIATATPQAISAAGLRYHGVGSATGSGSAAPYCGSF
jgi:hypothetical protein